MRLVRILLVSQMYPGPGDPDLGVFVRDLEQALAERGHDIERAVLDRRAGGKRRYLRLARQTLGRARAFRPDVVYAHFLVPTGLIVKGHGAALPGLQILADLGAVLFAASACFGLSAVFLRFAAVRLPILDGVSENAYGIYLFHYVFVIWTQYLLLGVSLPAIAKGLIVFAVTVVLSWAASAALRRVPLASRVMGAARPNQKPGARKPDTELLMTDS